MKLLSIQALRGPNYWSNNRKKLIELKIDLERFETLPSNKLEHFTTRLKELMPSLHAHHCSPGVPGGFFLRLEQGTWLGHIIEHIALELQCLAGMDCGFGQTLSAEDKGVYYVIFAYEIEKAGFYAAHAAMKLAETLAENKPYHELDTVIQTLRDINDHYKPGPSTQALINEATARNIPFFLEESESLLTLGHGINQKKLWATISSNTSAIAVDIAANKELTKKIVSEHHIPVPKGGIVTSLEELKALSLKLGYPLVTKPLDGNHGRGIITNIQTEEKLITGFKLAQKISKQVMVERHIEGDDFRFLVINYKVEAVAKRQAAHIVGTGVNTIGELIELVNQNPKRGKSHENVLTAITIDEVTKNILKTHKLSIDTILPKDKILVLKDTANLSSGGTAIDVTQHVHPQNILLAERAARAIGLDICGIDIVAKNISVPLNQHNGALLEVNAGPGLRMHLCPCEGPPRNVAKPIMDMLFPEHQTSTIPIISVTGTNGKTTVVRLIANLMRLAGHFVGFTTTEGIYLDNHLVYEGDCSGPLSAQVPLKDPRVTCAVLECARGGILRAGLGFNTCDMSIITNITSDHLGLNDIHTMEQLARVKGVLARSTKKEGYCILNSENDLTYALINELECQIALFGREKNSRIEAHCNQDGLACYITHGVLVIQNGNVLHEIAPVQDIPLTVNGTVSAMIQNILPACLAGFIQGLSTELLKSFFTTFIPTTDAIPGRMNIFDFPNSKVILDYGHNEEAYKELQHFLGHSSHKKLGIIAAAGDRRDEDIKKIGSITANLFDEIIIRHDEDGRGRSNHQLTSLLSEGILESNPSAKVTVISDELEAINHALKHSNEPTLIYYSVENVFRTIKHVETLHKNSTPSVPYET